MQYNLSLWSDKPFSIALKENLSVLRLVQITTMDVALVVVVVAGSGQM